MRNFGPRLLKAWLKLTLAWSRFGQRLPKSGATTSYDSDERMTSLEYLRVRNILVNIVDLTFFSVKFVKGVLN